MISGLIPAYVGSTLALRRVGEQAQAHPRLCGEFSAENARMQARDAQIRAEEEFQRARAERSAGVQHTSLADSLMVTAGAVAAGYVAYDLVERGGLAQGAAVGEAISGDFSAETASGESAAMVSAATAAADEVAALGPGGAELLLASDAVDLDGAPGVSEPVLDIDELGAAATAATGADLGM